MSDNEKNSTTQRRQALKKILAGTGAAGVVASAPEKWTKPVINSITLPSHAMTSLPLSYTDIDTNAMAPGNRLEELLIPAAHAGIFTGLDGGSICINFNADLETYTALVIIGTDQSAREFTGTGGNVNAAKQLLQTCSNMPEQLYLTLKSGPSHSGIDYELCDFTQSNCVTGTVMPSECSTTPEICAGD